MHEAAAAALSILREGLWVSRLSKDDFIAVSFLGRILFFLYSTPLMPFTVPINENAPQLKLMT